MFIMSCVDSFIEGDLQFILGGGTINWVNSFDILVAVIPLSSLYWVLIREFLCILCVETWIWGLALR